ncbi:hypothetical protein LCGC14_1306150 [marine sediment metagenome]|uniref:Uncharacterized protein n=1 Tax=marine sediment metagenome TaxID=412755 RepID=A0A0F9N4W0_9ZZZZ|nr:hypothetical protein [bacterium]
MAEAQYKKIKQSDVPNEFILHLSRYSFYFEDNSIKVYNYDIFNGKKSLLAEITVPEGLIVCDLCGTEITIEKIPLFVHYGISTNIQATLALCDKCLTREDFCELVHLDYLKPIEDNLAEINEFKG